MALTKPTNIVEFNLHTSGGSMALFNVTYEGHPFTSIYGRVRSSKLIKLSTKKGFKAFRYMHKPTRIAMVTVVNGNIKIGKYNG